MNRPDPAAANRADDATSADVGVGRRLAVVLGMHRSGTSAVTRGLEALGVDLGKRLMPGTPGVNDKGFFEDVDANAINVALYEALGGGQDWHTLALISREDILHERHSELRLRARALLASRLQQSDLFGMKDPRMCRLLPFWQGVFASLRLDVFYVIVVRNPLSVAASLERIHGLAPEKSHYLWLQHVLPSVLFTQGAARVLVDYDRVLEDPAAQVVRIARAVGLETRLDPARLADFSRNFMEDGLRHARFGAEDVANDASVPAPVKAALQVLADVAADRVSLDSPQVTKTFHDLSGQLEGMAPAMNYILRQENAVAERDHLLSQRDSELGERKAQLALQERKLGELNTAIQAAGATAVQINHRLRRVRSSFGWRLLSPARLLRKLWTLWRNRIDVDLVPFGQVQPEDDGWAVGGSKPQFLLVAEREWSSLAGWCWLHVDARNEKPMDAAILFDSGEGFDPARVIRFRVHGDDSQRVPLFIPPNCRTVRFDPCEPRAKFRLSVAGLQRLESAPVLPAEFLDQLPSYQASFRWQGNDASLEPTHDLQRLDDGDYTWRCTAADPRFALRGLAAHLRPGWHSVRLQIRSDITRGNARLYFDFGTGYSELGSVCLPFRSGEPVERLLEVKGAPRQVRLDPLEAVGRLAVEHLHFAPALPMFARNSMLRRLQRQHPDFQGQRIALIWKGIRDGARTLARPAADLLYEHYEQTFRAHGPHDSVSYADWIARFETPELSDSRSIQLAQAAFANLPVISVVMPVYNTPEIYLRRAIESVIEQSYPRWELCIADDASTDPRIRTILEEYARRDARVRLALREQNGHISAASNSALELATGDYVALLDHDDELAPNALHFVAESINRMPSAEIFYTDEDKIDGKGNRSEPHFKPDWNPDLFFSQNYVSHLGIYRRELLKLVGGFRVGVEGSQDQDLLLRCLPHVDPANIAHIPRVLYHWRIAQGSTAHAHEDKQYTTGAGIRALQDYFAAQGRADVAVEAGLVPNTYRARYPIPEPPPLVSLVIPTRDRLDFLEPCLRSIGEKTTYPDYEILVIDNGSVEAATLEYFRRIQAQDSRVRVLAYPHPFNFSAINNYGVQNARGQLVGLVNNDIEVIDPDWLTEMVSHALRPEIGCVGAKLYYGNQTLQHAGVIIGLGGVAGHSHKYFPRAASGYFHRLKLIQNLSAVTAACLVIRKSVYEEVGGMEESLGVAFNDVDFCLKVIRAGYRNLWTPYAELYHHESISRGTEDTPQKIERFNREIEFIKSKWGEALERDPCYSQNLTLDREDFSLR